MKARIWLYLLSAVCLSNANCTFAGEQSQQVEIPNCFKGNFFQHISVTSSNLLIKFRHQGVNYRIHKNAEAVRLSKPDEEISLAVGESLSLGERHSLLKFEPLPPAIRQYGFAINEYFNRLSIGRGEERHEAFVLICNVKQLTPVTNEVVVITRADEKDARAALKSMGITVVDAAESSGKNDNDPNKPSAATPSAGPQDSKGKANVLSNDDDDDEATKGGIQ